MESYLFLDTETTGFKKAGKLIQKDQARVCQIAMILTDHIGRKISEFSSPIKPDGWTISKGAQRIHGLTDDHCQKFGINYDCAAFMYHHLASMSDQVIAFNADFDRSMMEIESAYFGLEKKYNWHCAMKCNTHITSNGRWPKLEFAYKHYTGKDLINAHDAMADTKACMEIFFKMRGISIDI